MSGMKQDAKPRKTAAKALAGFMVLMALLTLGSRTLENIAMAEVVITRSTGGTIERVFNTNASVRASGDQSIKVEDALPVASVLVSQGDQVTAGQAILTLDVAPLEEKLSQAKIDLTKKRLDLESAKLEQPGTTPEETLREALRARQETGEQVSDAEIQANLNLVKAEEALADAKTMLQRVLDKAMPASKEALDEARLTRDDAVNEAAQTYDKAVKALQRLTDPNSGDLAKEKAEAYEAYETALDAHNEATESLRKALVKAGEAVSETGAEITKWQGYLIDHPNNAPIDPETGDKMTEAKINAQITSLEKTRLNQVEALADAQKAYEKGDEAGSKNVDKLWKAYQELANPNSEVTAERIAEAQKAVNDAKKAYDKTVKDQDKALAAAQLNYNMTKQAVDLHKAGTLESGIWDMPADIDAAITQVETGQTSLTDAQKAREKTLKDNNRTLEQADKTLNDVKKQVNYQSQADKIADENKRLSLMAAEQEIQKQEKTVTRLEELQASGGKITSPVAGTIAELSAQAGDVLTEGTIVAKIAAGEQSMELVATVSANDVKQLKAGLPAEMYSNNMWADGTIKSIKKAAADGGAGSAQTYEVAFVVNGGNPFQIGDSVRITVRQTSQRYSTIIPISSLREDSNGKFVFILEEQSGALGTKQIVRRVDVTVEESNETQAAVNGALSDWDKLVERGDRPLNDGDRVRIKQ